MERERKPNWAKWRHVPYVEVWRAVALSLGIDPDGVQIDRHSWMADHLVFDESQEFKDRVFFAGRNLGKGLTIRIMIMGQPEACSVDLSEFAAWAGSIEWAMPKELAALAQVPKAIKPAKDSSGVIDGKSRVTALKLILGMAMDAYRYNPRAGRSPIPKEIALALEDFGISVTDETVREWLKEAAQEIDWHLRDETA